MRFKLAAIATLLLPLAVTAATPGKYDTKFNVTANVPDSAMITDPGGRPVTDMLVELTPAASGKMEAQTTALRLWNNDVSKLEMSLTLDDGNAATGGAFNLTSTQGDVLNDLTYKITTISANGNQEFANSGDTKDYTLLPNGSHGELPVFFRFVSDRNYDQLGQGSYSGTVYANVVAKP